jgi:hypothetical protein
VIDLSHHVDDHQRGVDPQPGLYRIGVLRNQLQKVRPFVDVIPLGTERIFAIWLGEVADLGIKIAPKSG